MIQRKANEAEAIIDQLSPYETEDGVRCLAPHDLAENFKKFLQGRNVRTGLFGKVSEVDKIPFSEVEVEGSLDEAAKLVEDFACELAANPDSDIPAYWGGFLPPKS